MQKLLLLNISLDFAFKNAVYPILNELYRNFEVAEDR